MSSDRCKLNFSGPRRPEKAGLDRFGSASLSRGLVPDPGVSFTKGLSLDLDLKSRHLSLNHATSVVLDLADFTKQL